jgi:hypothetical protein
MRSMSGRLALAMLGAVLLASSAPEAEAKKPFPRTFPFAPSKALRKPARRDALPGLFDHGGPCRRGCPPPFAVRGWPIRPFHRQHRLRAGLNELRTGNLHTGVDILAGDGSRVYALQPGFAQVLETRGPDARVQVGRFIYWHVHPTVRPGQYVRPLRDVVGTVLRGQSHLHLSEVLGDRYLNPLRPGGRILSPWRDRGRPVLGRPRLGRGGRAVIRGFDPQSTTRRRESRTPVLGLAGLGYRLFNGRHRRIGPLHWAYRGSQHLPNSFRSLIYAPGTFWPAARCLTFRHRPCRPNWVYRLAGGIAPTVRPGRRRVYILTAYAWDWAGNVIARDTRVVRGGHRRRRHRKRKARQPSPAPADAPTSR